MLTSAIAQTTTQLSGEQYLADFDQLWTAIHTNYAYFDQKQTDWLRVRQIYREDAGRVRSRAQFVGLLEQVLEELYDPHLHLNVNTASSPRLVPSGADVWAGWENGRARVTQVRPGSRAAAAGIVEGLEITEVDGVPVRRAVQTRLGRSLRKPDLSAQDYALRALLAGRHNQPRRLTVTGPSGTRTVTIDDSPTPTSPEGLLRSSRLGSREEIGYIRIHNSLGDDGLIRDFDRALAELRDTSGLVLDLRDTPSGGNTTVARALMGRFIGRDAFYQKHSLPGEERRYGVRRSWMEIVSPRGPFRYKAPLVVLVDHWTGSMGEGMAIGLDGMKRATIVGTPMAGLLGATQQFRLTHTGFGVNIPTEKLFHVNGTPRERFIPPVRVDPRHAGTGDPILNAGLTKLQRRRT